jgi:putative transposase
MEIKTHYRNRLPHIVPLGGCFFITCRLADALPPDVTYSLSSFWKNLEGTDESAEVKKKRYFVQLDDHLDRTRYGKCALNKPEVAKIITDELLSKDGMLYKMQAFCLMGNHIHFLMDTSIQNNVPLYKIMQGIKGRSAFYSNKLLGTVGQKFWQKESYDHLVRKTGEWENIFNYILQNPVKAKLVEHWNDWPYTYVMPELLEEKLI